MLNEEDFIRNFYFVLDGVVENPDCLATFTNNNKDLEEIPALRGFGKNDNEDEFGFSTKSQIGCLINHYCVSEER